jgi:hypothetical protein
MIKKNLLLFFLLGISQAAYAIFFVDVMPDFQARDGYHSGNKELQYYDRSLALQKGTSFVLNLKKESTPNCNEKDPQFNCRYKSGWIDTFGKWSTGSSSKGTIVIQASVNHKQGVDPQGLWPAIWLLPNSLPPLGMEKNAEYPWPLNGEIDIMEGRGSNLNEIASTIHFGTDGATKHAYNGSIFKSSNANISNQVQYALSWDFTNQSNKSEMLYWNVKISANKEWKELKRIDLSDLIESDKSIETCPKLGLNYPEKKHISLKQCLLNVFQAGQESGYYLIVNLAVGGYYDGNPDINTDLSDSSMTVYSAKYYPDMTDVQKIPSLDFQ